MQDKTCFNENFITLHKRALNISTQIRHFICVPITKQHECKKVRVLPQKSKDLERSNICMRSNGLYID